MHWLEGSALQVLEALADNGETIAVKRAGLPDEFVRHGPVATAWRRWSYGGPGCRWLPWRSSETPEASQTERVDGPRAEALG